MAIRGEQGQHILTKRGSGIDAAAVRTRFGHPIRIEIRPLPQRWARLPRMHSANQ